MLYYISSSKMNCSPHDALEHQLCLSISFILFLSIAANYFKPSIHVKWTCMQCMATQLFCTILPHCRTRSGCKQHNQHDETNCRKAHETNYKKTMRNIFEEKHTFCALQSHKTQAHTHLYLTMCTHTYEEINIVACCNGFEGAHAKWTRDEQ